MAGSEINHAQYFFKYSTNLFTNLHDFFKHIRNNWISITSLFFRQNYQKNVFWYETLWTENLLFSLMGLKNKPVGAGKIAQTSFVKSHKR